MRHRLLALPLSVLVSLALASTALAGGWAQVNVTNGPIDPVAGEPTTIELSVLQHGVTPVSWPRLTVIATDAASGTVIRAEAEAKGPEGSYTASLTLPSAGDWTLTFQSADLVMEGSFALTAIAAVAAAAPAAAATSASGFDAMPLVLLVLAVFLAIVIAAVTMRSREGARDTRVSART
jgi:hypothetical protein